MIALILGGAAFALYAATLAPTVLAGDGGEFQFAPYLLGVAHPTGYPLYNLLGWLWSHLLPVGDVATRMNLFSAFWAALAVALACLAILSVLRQVCPSLPVSIRRLIAVLAAATLAVTPTLRSQAVIAEVYGLHLFFVALIFCLLLTWGEQRDRRLLLLVALCFGLSLAHHRTTLLLVPGMVAYVWITDRRALFSGRLVLAGLALALLPLLLYLYVPLRAPHTPYLRLPLAEGRVLVLYQNTWPSFFDFVLGGPFGGSVDLAVNLGERLSMAWGYLRDEMGTLGLVLALAGVIQLALRAAAPRALAVLALTGLTYLATLAFNLVYTIGDVYVMYIPAYLMVIFWLAIGVGGLASLLKRQRVVTVLFVLVLFVLPLWLAVTHYSEVDQSENRSARTGWEEILAEPLPSGAVLVSDDRNDIMPMWYFQYVDGRRPDLLGLFPLITPEVPTLGQILDLALSTGRPVYLIKEMPGVEVKVDVAAEGRLWRVLGAAVDKQPDQALNAPLDDALVLVGTDLSPQSPHPGEPLTVSLYWEALRPLDTVYHSFVHLVDDQGEKVAQSDQQPGGVYYPTTLWRPGEQLRDDHTLAIPADTPEGIYHLVAGMYALGDGGALQPLGEPVVLGPVTVKTGIQGNPTQ